jgi:PAS domain S-box-containing protein
VVRLDPAQAPRPVLSRLARLELWVPLAYAALSAAWIVLSDAILAAAAPSAGQQAIWSILKGLGFVAVTAALLHAGLRWALGRERRAHDRVASSEALLRAVTDAIPDPVFLKDRQGRWLFANPTVLAVIGKSAEEVLGRTDREIYPDPAVGTALMEIDRRIMESGVGQVVEETIQTPAGYRLFLSTKAPYRDPEGRVVGIIGSGRDITDRKRAEDALREQVALRDQLRESEGLYRSLFTLAPSAVVLLDERERILTFNQQAHRYLGYTAEEFAALRISDIEAGEARPEDVAGRLRRIAESGGEEFEALYRTRSGDLREVRVRSRPVEIGGRQRFLAVWQDLTEGRRMSSELRYQQDLNQSVARNAAESIFVTDELGRVVYANREAEATFGFALQELEGKILHDVIHRHAGSADAASECPMARMQREGLTFRGQEDSFVRRDGQAVSVSFSVGPLALGGGHAGSVLIVRDVTRLRRAEEALRRSEERFRALIERSTDMILVLDSDARFVFWSPSATEALGWAADDVLGRSPWELGLVHPDDRATAEELVGALLSGARAIAQITARARHRDGSWRLVESVGRNMLGDPAVKGVVVNARDVTEQRRLAEQFQQAQKLESVGRLAGGIAHDFNNLLTVILSCGEALRSDLGAGSPASPEDVEEIQAAAERARDLTRQLLAFARKQVIAPLALDLGDLVRGAEKLLRRLLGEDVELVIQAPPGLWPVRCDPGQIEQVLLNLAVNARDAMPGGGRLTIETANAEDPGGSGPGAGPRGERVQLTVRDTGAGMSPEVQAHLFEPFFTTKARGLGTGLGLATVYGIVEQSGGHIQVESEPGRGATFRILFPRTQEAVAAAAPAPARAARGTETVLVVEDDPMVRGVTVRALRSGGYRVLVAESGRQALDLAAGEPGDLHLLVADVVMPGASGREVAEELGRRRPGLRVLYVSGYTQDAIAQRGVLDSGIEFLPKPFTASQLLERVRAVLDAP